MRAQVKAFAEAALIASASKQQAKVEAARALVAAEEAEGKPASSKGVDLRTAVSHEEHKLGQVQEALGNLQALQLTGLEGRWCPSLLVVVDCMV